MFNHMVEHRSLPTLDSTYRALAHPVRRHMLTLLSRNDLRVTELAPHFNISLAAASKHVRQLERAGLVTRRVIGRDHTIEINALPLEDASEWLAQYRNFWPRRSDESDSELRS
jgi:DNA-binding transcriptional ArsR family regulator